jgi:hypothetical protein
MKCASITSPYYIAVFEKNHIMHKFQFFAIWNIVLEKKNRRSEIFVKSESSALVTIIFLTAF